MLSFYTAQLERASNNPIGEIMYTQKKFGKELKEKVLKKEDVVTIGYWCYWVYMEYIEDIDLDFREILLTLTTMEFGSDFAFSYRMLNKIADDLIVSKIVDLNS